MKVLEILLWTVGVSLIFAYFLVLGWTEVERRSGLQDFAMARGAVQQQDAAANLAQPAKAGLVGSPALLASSPAASSPAAAVKAPSGSAVAVLRIRRIQMEVPVSPGTEENVLQRGAGWIDGTAAPGSDGNVGIAAHRDSHFRGLKDVAVGDLIELETLRRTRLYRITDLSVVEPTDVHVLAETGEPVLTLVTCFPFYFVGHAPQRFIVRAAAIDLGNQTLE